jgi:prepilin-type processing-associated H-X9-DG protein
VVADDESFLTTYFGSRNPSILVCPTSTYAGDDAGYVYARLGVYFANNRYVGTSYRWHGPRGNYGSALSNTYFRRFVQYTFPTGPADVTVSPCVHTNCFGKTLKDPETGRTGFFHEAEAVPIAFDAYNAADYRWIGFNYPNCQWTNNHRGPDGLPRGINVSFFDGHVRWARRGEGSRRLFDEHGVHGWVSW